MDAEGTVKQSETDFAEVKAENRMMKAEDNESCEDQEYAEDNGDAQGDDEQDDADGTLDRDEEEKDDLQSMSSPTSGQPVKKRNRTVFSQTRNTKQSVAVIDGDKYRLLTKNRLYVAKQFGRWSPYVEIVEEGSNKSERVINGFVVLDPERKYVTRIKPEIISICKEQVAKTAQAKHERNIARKPKKQLFYDFHYVGGCDVDQMKCATTEFLSPPPLSVAPLDSPLSGLAPKKVYSLQGNQGSEPGSRKRGHDLDKDLTIISPSAFVRTDTTQEHVTVPRKTNLTGQSKFRLSSKIITDSGASPQQSTQPLYTVPTNISISDSSISYRPAHNDALGYGVLPIDMINSTASLSRPMPKFEYNPLWAEWITLNVAPFRSIPFDSLLSMENKNYEQGTVRVFVARDVHQRPFVIQAALFLASRYTQEMCMAWWRCYCNQVTQQLESLEADRLHHSSPKLARFHTPRVYNPTDALIAEFNRFTHPTAISNAPAKLEDESAISEPVQPLPTVEATSNLLTDH